MANESAEPDNVPDEYLDIRRASEVPRETLRWLWPGKVPIGHLTLLAGEPGAGKSLILQDMTARLSNGIPLPGTKQTKQCSTLIITSEEGYGDTVRPRLETLGADLGFIDFLFGVSTKTKKGRFSLPLQLRDHAHLLRDYLSKPENSTTEMVIIDPVTGHLGVQDANSEAESIEEVRAKVATECVTSGDRRA